MVPVALRRRRRAWPAALSARGSGGRGRAQRTVSSPRSGVRGRAGPRRAARGSRSGARTRARALPGGDHRGLAPPSLKSAREEGPALGGATRCQTARPASSATPWFALERADADFGADRSGRGPRGAVGPLSTCGARTCRADHVAREVGRLGGRSGCSHPPRNSSRNRRGVRQPGAGRPAATPDLVALVGASSWSSQSGSACASSSRKARSSVLGMRPLLRAPARIGELAVGDDDRASNASSARSNSARRRRPRDDLARRHRLAEGRSTARATSSRASPCKARSPPRRSAAGHSWASLWTAIRSPRASALRAPAVPSSSGSARTIRSVGLLDR